MKQTGICVAVLANVDAGKTTLAEQILLKTGVIRTAGRVDHGDSFLDTHELERRRGITIFSKMARIPLGGRNLTLLDTPGHVDFSAETERTLQIADCAVLLISAADGVTGHTMTLWSLLERYRLPTLIFVNKMDQQGADAGGVLEKLRKHLEGRAFTGQGRAWRIFMTVPPCAMRRPWKNTWRRACCPMKDSGSCSRSERYFPAFSDPL